MLQLLYYSVNGVYLMKKLCLREITGFDHTMFNCSYGNVFVCLKKPNNFFLNIHL